MYIYTTHIYIYKTHIYTTVPWDD